MASVKERFESIMNDGQLGESEAIKLCISYNKELQKEINELKKRERGSKLDRVIDTWLAWSREAPAEGRFFAHIGAALVLTGCLWAFIAMGLWTLDSYKEFKSDVPLSSEGYFMTGDSETVDGKSVNCYQIQFMRGNGSTYDAAPC